MSAQVTITQLPAAGTLTGAESVPIVQNGQTVRTTTGALATAGTLTQSFLTVNTEPSLVNSRALASGTGVQLFNNGSTLQINLNGTSGSLEGAGTGVIVKNSGTTVVARSIAVSGNGITIADGTGISGNPTISLTGNVLALAGVSANGLLKITTAGAVGATSIVGTSNQVTVTNGDGVSGSPTVSLADNPVLPGVASATLPIGTTGNRPGSPVNGMIRYNSSTAGFEGYSGGAWGPLGGGANYTAGTGLNLVSNQFSIADTGVTAASYGLAGSVPTLAVNAQGQITSASNTAIAINGNQITSGTVGVAYGGTNLSTYSVGDLLYASGSTTLSKLTLGTNGYVLSAGASAPAYVAQSTLSVGTATNIAGGTTGAVSYQSAAGTTTFLSLGTTNYVLTAGASAPQYVAQSTLAVGTSTNLAGGANGSLPYQTASGTTTFLAAGTNGYVLTLSGGVPTWAASASSGVTTFSAGTTGLTPNTATSGAITLAGTLAIANGGTNSTATPTAGGAGYGTGTAHAYTAAGTAGQVLLSNGSSAPTWSGVSGGTF